MTLPELIATHLAAAFVGAFGMYRYVLWLDREAHTTGRNTMKVPRLRLRRWNWRAITIIILSLAVVAMGILGLGNQQKLRDQADTQARQQTQIAAQQTQLAAQQTQLAAQQTAIRGLVHQLRLQQTCIRDYLGGTAPLAAARDKAIQQLWDDVKAFQTVDPHDPAAQKAAGAKLFADLDVERQANQALQDYRDVHNPGEACQ